MKPSIKLDLSRDPTIPQDVLKLDGANLVYLYGFLLQLDEPSNRQRHSLEDCVHEIDIRQEMFDEFEELHERLTDP